MRVLPAILLCLATGVAVAEPYEDLLARARAAFERQDYQAAARALDAAQQQHPYSLFLTNNRIAARAMAGDADGALRLARSVAARGLFIDLSGQAFDGLRKHPGFAALTADLAANNLPRGQPMVELESGESGLLPEALARQGGQWVVGSVRTGAILFAGGTPGPVTELQGGVYDIALLGNRLFAAVSPRPPFKGPPPERPAAFIVELEWPSGRTLRSAELDGDALMGDIEVARDGRVFATDSLTPRLVVLERGRDAFRVLSRDPRFVNLQGLALDESRNRLFVADYLAGVFVVDPDTGATQRLANPRDVHLGGVDGLYLHQGDLVGIQNGVVPQRIVRIRLDPAGTTATRLDVLQQGLADWNEPTHGVVLDGKLYYLATSNWPAYGDAGSLREGASLAPLRIMSVALD